MENADLATFSVLRAPFFTLPFGSPLNATDLSPLTRIIHERSVEQNKKLGEFTEKS